MPIGIKTKAKEPAPYKPVSKADEIKRKTMYADSAEMSNKGYELMYTKELGSKANQKQADEKTADATNSYLPHAKTRTYNNRTVDMHPTSINVSMDKEDKDNNSYITKLGFPAPKQKILDYTPPTPPPVSKIAPKKIVASTDDTPIPSKLNPITTTPMPPSNLTVDRTVNKVKYTPSTKPGYENMKEYGTYSKDGDEVVVPKSAVQSQYKNGTMEINVKPKPKSTPTAQADAKNEKEKPSKMAYEDKPSMKQLETTSVKNKYAMGTRGIKTKKMTAKQFEDSPEDKRVDAKAMKSMNKTGAYAEGTKSIKMKPKMSMDSDATATAPVRLPAGKPAFTNYSKQLSTLSDNDVYKEVADNRLNMTNNSAKWNEAQDTINTRNTKKALIAAEGGYKMGSKGIKTKKMY